MAFTLSRHIEDALWRAAERVLPAHVLGGRALGSAIIERSRRYTSEREYQAWRRPDESPTRGAADAAAHALFFTVADAPKIILPLAELDARGLLVPEAGAITILDLGAGAGAMSLGIIDYLALTGRLEGRELVIHAIDHDRRALDIMGHAIADIAAHLGARISLTTECADIHHAARTGRTARLVVAGSILNELDPGARLATVQTMLVHTHERGAAIVIEPALRETTRDLHQVRDAIVAQRLAQVFAPCTRTRGPCPALDDPDDWCHEDRRSDLTPRAARLAASTGLRTHGLKFAYLTLRHDESAQVSTRAPGSGSDSGSDSNERVALRIVSQPVRSKGKRECVACGAQGHVRIRLLRRNRGPDKRPFERTRRGDVLVLPARLEQGGDIERSDTIEVHQLTGVPAIPQGAEDTRPDPQTDPQPRAPARPESE